MKQSFNILVIAELREIKDMNKIRPIKLINKATENMIAKNDEKSLSVLCPWQELWVHLHLSQPSGQEPNGS